MHACDPAPPWLDASPDHHAGFKPGGHDVHDADPDLQYIDRIDRIDRSTSPRWPRTSSRGR